MFGGRIVQLNPDQVREHLKHIVRLLKKFGNYELAFIKKDLVYDDNLFFSISEKLSVRIESYDITNHNRINVSIIEEPTVVKAFEENYLQLWESISPVNRDKEEIIGWLEKQIAVLKTQKAFLPARHPDSQ
jgi:hypothetical protein